MHHDISVFQHKQNCSTISQLFLYETFPKNTNCEYCLKIEKALVTDGPESEARNIARS